jgi:hypothetical protein
MSGETPTPAAPDAAGSVDAQSEEKAGVDNPGVQKAEERKHKLKYGKTEREVSESELIAMAQKGWAADERFKSAAQKERELKEAYEKGDLDHLISKMKGKSKLDFAREVLKEELKRRSMSPQEQEEMTRSEKIERLRKEESDLEKKAEERKMSERTKHYEEQYDKELSEAWKTNKMPNNKYVMGRAIKIASEIVDMNLEPDWNLVVKEAKRQWQEEVTTGLDGEEDYSFIGAERAKKIAKWLQTQGMPKQEAQSQAARIVKQEGKAPDTKLVDENEYWEKKRKAWAK